MDQFFQKRFLLEYSRLNQEQKQAVDTTEGPVMVIAGAGTGKTQTIALRIANIILNRQLPPSAILCLTFTDSAAVNMRSRLLSIIGPPAYSVKICTYHSFCNEIIQENRDFFSQTQNFKNLDDLEKIDLIQNIIEKLPDGSPLKPWRDHFFYQSQIIDNIQTLKREGIAPDQLSEIIKGIDHFLTASSAHYNQLKSLRFNLRDLGDKVDEVVSSLLNLSNLPSSLLSTFSYHRQLFCSGGYNLGPAKSPSVNYKNALIKTIDDLSRHLARQQDLCEIYRQYQQSLEGMGFYDYEDMILFVINAFRRYSELLLSYQERYQYILVDEYQDTNSAQNQIVDLLASYYDQPNVFVVGDDDQAIFRFQGASIENIYHFYHRYHVRPIVLKTNYRSHQLLLDAASSVIGLNQNRISRYLDIDKSLVASQKQSHVPVSLFAAPTNLDENYFVAQKVKELLSIGVSPSQIAILYRNNDDSDHLCEILSSLGIRFYLPTQEDLLKNKLFIQLINLLNFIQDPGRFDLVYHILSSPFISLPPLDLLKLVQYSSRHQRPLDSLILASKKLKQVGISPGGCKKIRVFVAKVAQSRLSLENYSLDRFFYKIIRRFGFLKYCLLKKDPRLLNQLHFFYSQLKTFSLQHHYSLADFLDRLDRLNQNHLPFFAPPLVVDQSDSVQLMTVHKAKGLEFEHVFLIKVVDKKWGNNVSHSALRLPMGIIQTEISRNLTDDNEDERRLFYVALTRAKLHLYLSYSQSNENGRPQLPSVFVSEINPKLTQAIPFQSDHQSNALYSALSVLPRRHLPAEFASFLSAYIKNDYRLSVTHLNSYLRCPFCFLHKTILRIPLPKDKSASFGTAIHQTLAFLYHSLSQNNTPPPLDEILARFKNDLTSQRLPPEVFEETLPLGSQMLSGYYHHYHDRFSSKVIVDYDFSPENIHLGDVPITGKIDKIEIVDHRNARVVDFKTGNPDSKSRELSEDGDYFRQLVFYRLLAEKSHRLNYRITSGAIDFIEPSRLRGYVRREFDLDELHVKKLKELVLDVYRHIADLDFYHLGKDCQDKHRLHYLLDK